MRGKAVKDGRAFWAPKRVVWVKRAMKGKPKKAAGLLGGWWMIGAWFWLHSLL